MIEEDIVLLFSSNKNFLDLVLTFSLEIDYGNDITITPLNECDTGGDSDILQDIDREADIPLTQEGGDHTSTDGSLPVGEVQDGHPGCDSPSDGAEGSLDGDSQLHGGELREKTLFG